MIRDIITPAQRLSRLSPNLWEHRLSLLFFVIALLLCLALMCENVNAAPQESVPARIGTFVVGLDSRTVESGPNATRGKETEREPRFSAPAGAAPFNAAPQAGFSHGPRGHLGVGPASAAPFTLAHPLCQTGFWIKQRVDDRDRDGVIIKSRWVFGCAKGRIVYGRKV